MGCFGTWRRVITRNVPIVSPQATSPLDALGDASVTRSTTLAARCCRDFALGGTSETATFKDIMKHGGGDVSGQRRLVIGQGNLGDRLGGGWRRTEAGGGGWRRVSSGWEPTGGKGVVPDTEQCLFR